MEELLSRCRRAYDEFLYLFPLTDTYVGELVFDAKGVDICFDSKQLNVSTSGGIEVVRSNSGHCIYSLKSENTLVTDEEIRNANHHLVRRLLLGTIIQNSSNFLYDCDSVLHDDIESLCTEMQEMTQMFIDFLSIRHKINQHRDSFLYVSDKTIDLVLLFYQNQVDYYEKVISQLKILIEAKALNK